MKKLVLLRHGQSAWNEENRFTGWVDVPLSPLGLEEAQRAGQKLRGAGHEFDVAYTSLLQRAIKTLWVVLEQLESVWIPIHESWRLNLSERCRSDRVQGIQSDLGGLRFAQAT